MEKLEGPLLILLTISPFLYLIYRLIKKQFISSKIILVIGTISMAFFYAFIGTLLYGAIKITTGFDTMLLFPVFIIGATYYTRKAIIKTNNKNI